MKNIINIILITTIVTVSCKSKTSSSTEKLPAAVNTIVDVQKLIINKKWQVIDVATVNGSRVSKFAMPEINLETIVAPNIEKLNWFSNIKGIDTAKDFAIKFYRESFDKFKMVSVLLSKDSVATVTGMEVTNQQYILNDDKKTDEPNGVKLKLISIGKMFESMEPTKLTTSYYVLGINNKMLYLLTPNKINEENVVFLLEAK